MPPTSNAKPYELADVRLDFETGLCEWRIGHGRWFEQHFSPLMPKGCMLCLFGQELRVSPQVKFLQISVAVTAYQLHDPSPLVVIGPTSVLKRDGQWRRLASTPADDSSPRRLLSTDPPLHPLKSLTSGKAKAKKEKEDALVELWLCTSCGEYNLDARLTCTTCDTEREKPRLAYEFTPRDGL